MDTVRLNLENFQPRNLPMEFQEHASSPSVYLAAEEWNKSDGTSVEDAWMISFKTEVSELLEALEESQKMIKAEIMAHRWICQMESKLEYERERADMLDEYEREMDIEHQLEMESLKQEHQRLQELKAGKRESKIECMINIEEADLAESTDKNNAKKREGQSTGCFSYFRKLFRRSKSKTKKDGEAVNREDAT